MARSSSARLLTVPLLICGKERFFVVMVLERRYGPRRLRGPDEASDGAMARYKVTPSSEYS